MAPSASSKYELLPPPTDPPPSSSPKDLPPPTSPPPSSATPPALLELPVPLPPLPSRNIKEKALILFDFLQLFSVLLALSFSHWPNAFLSRIQPLALSSLDLTLLSQSAAQFNTYESYLSSSSTTFPLPTLPHLTLLLQLLPFLPYLLLKLQLSSLPSFKTSHPYILLCRRRTLAVTDLLLLPLLLNTTRLFQCSTSSSITSVTHYIAYSSSFSLDIDPTISCTAPSHITITVLSSLLSLYHAFFLFRSSYYTVLHATSYNYSPLDHEKMLQVYEIGHAYDLTPTYAQAHLSHMASFRSNKRNAYHRIHVYVVKTVVCGALLVAPNSHLCAALIWSIFVIHALQIIFFQPYRLPSSNAFKTACDICLIFAATFLVFTIQKVRTPFVLPTRQTLLLTAALSTLAVALCAVALYVYLRDEQWPSYTTLAKLRASNNDDLQKWVACIRLNSQTINQCTTNAQSLHPIHHIESQMYSTRLHLLKATKASSLFAVPLSQSLDDLAHCHNTHRHDSLLPGGELAEALTTATPYLLKRRYHRLLQSPIKRRILIKLLALRFFIGGRKIRKLRVWETEMKETAAALSEEYGVLLPSPPMSIGVFSSVSVGKIEALCGSWKTLLKAWETVFEINEFRKPSSDDKRKRQDWYVKYKTSHAAYELLREKNPPLKLESSFQKKREEVISACEELLKGCWGDGMKERIETGAKRVKDLIKQWEAAFGYCFELPVSNLVKKDFVGDLYGVYNDLKEAKKSIGALEDKFEEFEKAWLGGLKNCSVYSVEGGGEELLSVSSGVKELVKAWQDEFEMRTGRGMTSDDKRARTKWYSLYSDSKHKQKYLAAAKKKLKELEKGSKALLRMEVKEVRKGDVVRCKGEWKKKIKEWEQCFLLEQKRGAESEDKLIIKGWYVRYKQLSELGLQMDRIALETMGLEGL